MAKGLNVGNLYRSVLAKRLQHLLKDLPRDQPFKARDFCLGHTQIKQLQNLEFIVAVGWARTDKGGSVRLWKVTRRFCEVSDYLSTLRGE